MMHRYYDFDFSPWWLLVGVAMWSVVLLLAFQPKSVGNDYEPGVRHPVQTQMDIPLCYQVEGLPEGYCDYLTNKEAP